jgi:hypothetical protein
MPVNNLLTQRKIIKRTVMTMINEYTKSTSDKMIDVYIELFNIIFETGIIPDSWLVGYIKLIYKNKRDKLDPNNYQSKISFCVIFLFKFSLTQFKSNGSIFGKENA